MGRQIEMELVVKDADREEFWKEKNRYQIKDIFPNDTIGTPLTREQKAWFFSKEYRESIHKLCIREINPAYAYFFKMDGKRIGFVLYCTYQSEDGKCFILDFCIYSAFRKQGIGKECFSLLEETTKQQGAAYYELNVAGHQAKRFWECLGFAYNGFDANETLLLLKKPKEEISLNYEILEEKDIWQILNLENGYRYEMDDDFLAQEGQKLLEEAVKEKQILFFVAKRKTRVVGMCSISTVFSTEQGGYIGMFEDMYIEPAFRGKKVAKTLVDFAFDWCHNQGIGTVCVSSSESDKTIYAKLGFKVLLGRQLAWIDRK